MIKQSINSTINLILIKKMKYVLSYIALTILMTNMITSLQLRNRWYPDILGTGERLNSSGNKYYAVMQDDGNFVVYSSASINGKGKDNPTWNTNTYGQGQAPYRVIMQKDGNLVLYDKTNAALWNSQTSGKGTGPYSLIMQNDGNLVIYDTSRQPIWASNTMNNLKRRKY